MRSHILLVSFLGATALVANFVACSGQDGKSGEPGATGAAGSAGSPGQGSPGAQGSAGAQGAQGTQGPPGTPADGGLTAPAKLVLSLDPTLDGQNDSVKVTTITSADLKNGTGTTIAAATIGFGDATFSLSAVAAGDYFIAINGDLDDLVPTRIDDPTKDVRQRVGMKLRASRVEPAVGAGYRINTYSLGQLESTVAAYSTGAVVSGQQPYVIVTLGTPKIEFKVLGTGAALSSYTPTVGVHASNGEAFYNWLLNTNGVDHHGDIAMGDGGTGNCIACHANLSVKPSSYASTITTNGWCFHCHNGPAGDSTGFVDSNR